MEAKDIRDRAIRIIARMVYEEGCLDCGHREWGNLPKLSQKPYLEIANKILGKAEISFRAGIREVVEWIDEHCSPNGEYEWTTGEWQRQKKDWGVEPKED